MEEKRRSSALINAGINGGMLTWIRSIAKQSMTLYVPIVKSRFGFMEIRIGNIAPTSAISMTDLEVAAMTKERMEEEKRYLATMSIAKNLLKQGIISEEEYCQIDTKFKEQYAVSFSTLFTDIDLINYGKCGNM